MMTGIPAALAAGNLPLAKNAGLLFPGGSARELSELPTAERPKQLVVIDGTWHQAKTMLRDIPALKSLPRYCLSPISPGNYRIRREPSDTSLSTLEATVAALRILEPETPDIERLLDAFGKMVDDQLAHPNCRDEWRRKKTINRPSRKIPQAILGDLGKVVVAYGEAAPERRGDRKSPRAPLVWVAQRLVSGEQFASTLKTDEKLSDSFLNHLDLPREFFNDAALPTEFRQQWGSFLKPADTLVVFHKGSLALLRRLSPIQNPTILLKSVCANLDLRYPSIDLLPLDEQATSTAPPLPGRAGRRLERVISLVRRLRALGSPYNFS